MALRLAGIYENGTGVEKDLDTAYSLYLQAQLAIRERRKAANYYGDEKVESEIESGLKRCRQALPEDYFRTTVSGETPYMILSLLDDSEGLDMMALEKDGAWYLLARRADGNEDGVVQKNLFTLPEMDLCMLSDTVIMRADEADDVIKYAQTDTVYVNHIAWSEEDGSWLFMYQDYPMIEVKCKTFSFEL